MSRSAGTSNAVAMGNGSRIVSQNGACISRYSWPTPAIACGVWRYLLSGPRHPGADATRMGARGDALLALTPGGRPHRCRRRARLHRLPHPGTGLVRLALDAVLPEPAGLRAPGHRQHPRSGRVPRRVPRARAPARVGGYDEGGRRRDGGLGGPVRACPPSEPRVGPRGPRDQRGREEGHRARGGRPPGGFRGARRCDVRERRRGRAPRVRLVLVRRDGRDPVLHGHRGEDRLGNQRQPDHARGRGVPEGAAEAHPRAARDPPGGEPPREHAPAHEPGRRDPAGDARLLPFTEGDRRPRPLRRGESLRPARHRARAVPEVEGMSATEDLSALAEEYWEARLADAPLFATAIGDRRFDDKLSDISPEGRSRWGRLLEDVIARAHGIPEDSLREENRVTRSALITEAESELAYLRCGLDEWSVDPLGGPQVSFLNVESYQTVRTPDEGRAMVARWRAMGPHVDQHIANLRESLAAGKVAVRDCVEKVIGEIEDLAGKPENEWPLLKPVAVAREDWTEAERAEFREGLTRAVSDSIRPAFGRYVEMLRSELLPRSRPPEMPGIFHVVDGAGAYRKLIRVYTSLDPSPADIHETGLREVARVNGEMQALGKELFGLDDRRAILEKLRTDPDLYFTTRDEVAAKAESALARAKAAVPKWFRHLPKAGCVVVRMGGQEEKHSTIRTTTHSALGKI